MNLRVVAALITIGALNLFPGIGSAAVLNFDDLAGYYPPVPTDYKGFHFSGWYIDSTCSGGGFNGAVCSTYPYTPESLPTTIFPIGVNAISNQTPFLFRGAYVTGHSFSTWQFQLYKDGALVGTSSVYTPTAIPTFVPSDYPNPVDTVMVVGSGTIYAVMDNFTYDFPTPDTTDGPLPLWALGALGAGLVGIASRRQNKVP